MPLQQNKLLSSVPLGLKSGTYLRDGGLTSGIGGVLILRLLTLQMSQAGTKSGETKSGGIRRISVLSRAAVQCLREEAYSCLSTRLREAYYSGLSTPSLRRVKLLAVAKQQRR